MDEMMQDREASGMVWHGVSNLDELVIVLGGSSARGNLAGIATRY